MKTFLHSTTDDIGAAVVIDPSQDGWPGGGRLRRFTFYGLAGLFAAVLSLDFLHHLLDFSADGGVHHIHVAMHAVITGSLLIGIALQLRSPARRVAAMQTAFVVSVVTATIGALTGGVAVLPIAFIVVGGILSLLHSSRGEILRTGRVNRALLIAASLAATPVIGYALGQFRLQINRADPIHSSSGHYAVMAAATLSLLFMVVLASLGARGYRVPGWTAAIGAVVLGALSIVGPADSSSLGIGWGVAAIAGGIVVVGLVEWHARDTRTFIDGSSSHPPFHPRGQELGISR
jgi:hypothetical protein